MSKWVIAVPGIMGTTLRLGREQIWPPTAWDVISSDYDRIDDLMNPAVKVGTLIYKMAVVSVYKPLIEDIQRCGYQEGGAARRLVEFPYDWRKSNSDSAGQLAARLDELTQDGSPDELTFVAHSMGGLVVRRLLEGGEYNDRHWFPSVARLITLGTPHFGAPLALARLKGDEKVLGVSGPDIVRLASDNRYASSYELVGPADNAFALDRVLRGELPKNVDRFGAEYTAELDLQEHNIRAANEFWSHLDLARRPESVQYFFVGGAAHKTVTVCQRAAGTVQRVVEESAGDGTVPVASAVARAIPHMFSQKSHRQIFEDRSVRQALYRFLDAPVGVSPQSAAEEPVGQDGAVGLSVDQTDYKVGEPIEVVVSYASPVDHPRDRFGLKRLTGADTSELVESFTMSLTAPNISRFAVTIQPDLEPGIYELTTQRPSDDPAPTTFRVVTT